jgi:hypothetical protein
MHPRLRKAFTSLITVATVLSVTALPVTAAGPDAFSAKLSPVPHKASADGGSNVTGSASLRLLTTNVQVKLTARGLSPNLPHLAHIHGDLQAQNECPTIKADTDKNGLIDTLEGLPAYGPVLVTFSTDGTTSPSVAFDPTVAPVADASGNLVYERSIKVSDDIRSSLGDLHIVVHGLDLNGNGVYDGPISSAGVALELELPVACGTIN